MIKIQTTYSKFITDYYSIKKYNSESYRLTYHKHPVKRPGFESNEHKAPSRDINPDKLENHLARAKSKVYELAMCNKFEYFVTFTLSPEKYDRYNLKKFIKDLGQFIRNYRRDYNVNIQYLLIPEQHEDGAWHMHGLLKGIPESQLSINKNGYLDWEAYSVKFGYISLGAIKSREAVAKYITKYITKTLEVGKGVTEKNKKAYYASRGLEVAQKVKEGTLSSYQLEKIPFDFENNYVKTKTLNGLEYLRLNNQLG